jgi:hypothetical protein
VSGQAEEGKGPARPQRREIKVYTTKDGYLEITAAAHYLSVKRGRSVSLSELLLEGFEVLKEKYPDLAEFIKKNRELLEGVQQQAGSGSSG